MVGSSRDVTRSQEEEEIQDVGKVLRGLANCHKDCAGVEEEGNRKGGRASPELEQGRPNLAQARVTSSLIPSNLPHPTSR